MGYRSSALKICNLAILLALLVILMGGWTRIMDAGLGCPDWPGCFGHLVVPSAPDQVAIAEQRFTGQIVDQQKGWIEMIHRYMAATLGLLIVILACIGWKNRAENGYPVVLSMVLLLLVITQGLFGMWTVTLKLLPQIVTAHLFGGLLTLTLLVVLRKKLLSPGINRSENRGSYLMQAALIILFLQIILGGWTSANYAGWSCNHWLGCLKDQTVELDYAGGFSLPEYDQRNFQGGVLHHEARAAIQMTHRLGAVITAMVLLLVIATSLSLQRCTRPALILGGLLLLQVLLGFLNVVLGIPVLLALLHHGVAVLLLMTLLWLKNRYETELSYG